MGEGDMGTMALQTISDDSDVPVSEEAVTRISWARHRDVMFAIRQIAPKLSAEDAHLLAAIFLEAENGGLRLSKGLVEEGLRRHGRSAHAAEQISSAIFK
jgi:hypothetical protein